MDSAKERLSGARDSLAAELIDDAAAFLAAVEKLIAPCADTESAN